MNDKKIYLSRIFPEIGEKLLKEAGFEVNVWPEDRPMTQNELIEMAKQNDALYCTVTDKIDKKLLQACSHLDIISQFAVGFDNIDVDEATKLGIPVANTPNAMTNATADIAFGLLLATSRKMFYLHKQIIEGEWKYFRPQANLGLELKNKTLGIFGMGRIGIEMAKRCKYAYDMNILYHDQYKNTEAEKKLNAKQVDFESLLSESDVISVHCSLNPDTKEIFNKDAFSKMKKLSIFINAARGGVHNELDLIDALKNETIWGAGLDVTNPEPMKPDNPLLFMENATVLPHIGSSTVEARNGMAQIAAENIIEFYKKNSSPNVVNPEVLKK